MEAYRPLRRPPRKRGPDRGLPAAADRLKLAATYLRVQRQQWPALAAGGLLPADTEAVLRGMADDLARRHTTRALDDAARAGLADLGGRHAALVKGLGVEAAYVRYSCENSETHSLDDQLSQILRKARDLRVFVPWPLVFCDASVSGADASRRGYNALKAVLDTLPAVGGVLIDEFSRAGRDTLEWFQLAAWAKKRGKNVRGAADGFDLNSPSGQMMLHVFAMFSEFFRHQLRDKVLRGMRHAAERRTSTGRPPLGYGLRPTRDERGLAAVGADGRPVQGKCLHGPTMAHVEAARRMLLDEGASVDNVVREFNRLRVDGSDGWTDCSVRRTLSNPVYLGFDIYDRTRNEWDPETGRRKTVVNPRKVWKRWRDPRLQVWDRRTYLAVRRVLRGRGGRRRRRRSQFAADARPSRNERKPTRLLSGTMACRCGQELKEVRGGHNAAYGCYHGYFGGTHGCTMGTAKAAAILEEAVLDYVHQHVLTPAAVGRLAALRGTGRSGRRRARRSNVAPLEAEEGRLVRSRRRLIDLAAGDESAELGPVRDQIVGIGKEIAALQARVRQARRASAGPVPPLTAADVRECLADLRGLLNSDPAAAGLALRSVTGPIAVTDERYGPGDRYGGAKGGRWRLTFTPRLARALAGRVAGRPAADLGERLAEAAHAEAEAAAPVTLVVDRRQAVHVRLAPRVAPFIGRTNPATGLPYTRADVAAELGCGVDVLYLAWRFAETGVAREGPGKGLGRGPRRARRVSSWWVARRPGRHGTARRCPPRPP